MRLPRMTTRRWMVVIVVVGLMMGGIIEGIRLKRRHDYYESRVQHHARMESHWADRERKFSEASRYDEELTKSQNQEVQSEGHRRTSFAYRSFPVTQLREDAETYGRHAAYHAAMACKYRHAARYPWLPVEPDPPVPKWQEFFKPY